MAENNGTNGGTPIRGTARCSRRSMWLASTSRTFPESPDTQRFFRGPGRNPNLQLNFNVQETSLPEGAYEVALSP